MDILASPWFWGLGGAFVYSGPRLSTCLFAGRESGNLCKCWVDGAVSLAIGPWAAAALTGSVQGYLGMGGVEHMPAVSATIGLLANPLAPGAIEVITAGVMQRLKTWSGGK